MLQRYKEKTPKALNELLLSTPYFQANWKKILTTYHLLNKIQIWNEADKDTKGASEITRKRFSDLYGAQYPQVVATLESVGLLEVIRIWSVGHCYRYLITPKAHDVLKASNTEYLHILMTDQQEKRRNQVRISKRGYNKLQYGDVRDSQKQVIDAIEFEESDIHKVIAHYPTEKASRVLSLLINIVEKDYSDLKYNNSDNRVWTPYLQLPAEIKAVIKLKGMEYLISGDIRSCYPSCWGRYVYTLSGNQDALKQELERYEAIFLDSSRDPKAYLSRLLGINRTEIKEVLIKYFNGYRIGKGKNNPFRKFDTYLQTEFPLLYRKWRKTDIKQTGNNIGKMFETKLMLDGSIYAKAEELGLLVGYEYDGFSVYGEKEGSEDKIDTLLAFIEQRSVELLGFKLVLVRKDNQESLEQLCAMHIAEHLQREIAHNDKKLRTMRVSNHKLPRGKRRWEQYYLLKEENDGLLAQLEVEAFKAGLLN